MTGRRLYDALTDAWATQEPWNRQSGTVLTPAPLAWAFLTVAERRTLNRAAGTLSPKRKAKP